MLICLCVLGPYNNLNPWVQCLSNPSLASKKKEDVKRVFEERVLDNFLETLTPIKTLARGLREIIFYKPMDSHELEDLVVKGLTRKIQLNFPACDGSRYTIGSSRHSVIASLRWPVARQK